MLPRFTLRGSASAYAALLSASALLATAVPVAISPATAADRMYKRVEADGSVTFTDQPLPDAQPTEGAPISVIDGGSRTPSAIDPAAEGDVDGPTTGAPGAASANAPASAPSGTPAPGAMLAPPATLTPSPAPASTSSEPDLGSAVALVAEARILSPHDGATLVDDGEPARLELAATLGDGLDVGTLETRVLVDGEVVAAGTLDAVEFPMPGPGAHRLEAQVLDSDGRVLSVTAPQTVHVKTLETP